MLQSVMSSWALTHALNSCLSTILCLWTLFHQTVNISERAKTGRRGSRPLYKTGMFSNVFLCVKSIREIEHQTYIVLEKELALVSVEVLILFLKPEIKFEHYHFSRIL